MALTKIQHPKISHKAEMQGKPSSGKSFFWIWAEGENRRIVWGAYGSYGEADRVASGKLNVPYEIVELNTRDEGQASRILRARMLGDTGDIDGSFVRFSHKVPSDDSSGVALKEPY
jgi:hypothetical protein